MSERRGWPLFWVVGSALVLLVTVAVSLVAGTGYSTSRSSTDLVWRSLAGHVADLAMTETTRFLEPAVPAAALGDAWVQRGELDPQDVDEMLAFMVDLVSANPGFTWVSFSRTDGAYLTAYRWPVDDGEVALRRALRLQEGQAPDGTPLTRFRVEQQTEVGTWVLVEEVLRSYDPRVRPFYLAATAAPRGEGVWVDPYIFVSRKQPGVGYARASYDPLSDELLGVWTVEFECEPLSASLGTVEISEGGRVYLLAGDGTVVGHPEGQVSDPRGPRVSTWNAAEHPDQRLRSAWLALREQADPRQPFEAAGNLVMASEVGRRVGLDWLVLTVVPRDDVFAPVDQQLRTAVWIAVAVVLVSLLLASVLSNSVARSFDNLRREMYRIARFRLSDERLSAAPSPFREVNDMSAAADAMKQGLRAFGKYVPRQLVEQLLESEQEAGLEADNREVTVMFTDIAGFTPAVEGTAPPVLLAALQDYLEAMNRPIAETEGSVVQYLGDSIMALWGAPVRLEDHALSAAYAALAMRDLSRQMVESFPAQGWPAFPSRFGLQTGEVLVGNIGARSRFSYGALGDAVNTAARLEGLNKTYGTEILVGAPTARLIGEALVLREVDRVRVVGRKQDLDVYELLGRREELDQGSLWAIDRYEAGLRHYRARRWAEARRLFEEALELREGRDRPSEVMLRRIRTYEEEPPPEGWSGAHVMRVK